MDNYDYVALTNEVVRRGANLFGTFEEWTKGAFALSALGENGRVLFKNISKLSDKYNEVENDKKFTNALRTNSQVSIASFIYMCQQKGIDTNKFFLKDGKGTGLSLVVPTIRQVKSPAAFVDIDGHYVTDSLDVQMKSDFVTFLKMLVDDDDRIRNIVETYRIGVTKQQHTIFWYVDIEDKVRYGKIMAYGKDGHRMHDIVPQSIPCELSKQGKISKDYTIKKTLFGEHLLNDPMYADKLIGIVESEKTAVICSLYISDVLWMATGSLGNLQAERLQAVKSRRVILYPDADEMSQPFCKWKASADALNEKGWQIQVSGYLETVATFEQKQKKIDIADLLVANLQEYGAG